MMVGGALVPHTPLLLPTIGKEARNNFKQTIDGLNRLQTLLTDSVKPDTIILIKTPERGRRRRTVFQIQLPQRVCIDFSEFGDLITRGSYECDMILGTELKGSVRASGIPLTYTSEEKLEYTAGIPLLTLFPPQSVKVIVVQPPDTDLATLFAFGAALTASLQESAKRIVCLAAGDCAHCSHKGKKEAYEHICLPFDYMFMDAVQKKSPGALLAIKREEIAKLNACAVPPSIVLRGILDSLSWNSRRYSYEAPFGVGYAVIEFVV